MKIYELFPLNQDGAVDIASVGVDLGDLEVFAVEVNFSGSDLAGTLTLECRTSEYLRDGVTPRDWVTVLNSSQSVTLATDHVWNTVGAGYRWVRVVWDYGTGAGTLQAQLTVKERVVKEG